MLIAALEAMWFHLLSNVDIQENLLTLEFLGLCQFLEIHTSTVWVLKDAQ